MSIVGEEIFTGQEQKLFSDGYLIKNNEKGHPTAGKVQGVQGRTRFLKFSLMRILGGKKNEKQR